MDFKHWLLQTGVKESSAKKYSGAVSNSISKWAKQAGLIQNSLIEVNNIKEFSLLSNKIKKLEIFVERNTSGNSMYSAALNHYAAYITDVFQEEVKEDIENILDDPVITITEKSQLVAARVGQGGFRNSLINYWQCCALTGYSDTRLLVASHIKPWRDAGNIERLDQYNGLLLLPNLDKVFDLGFISFRSAGEIIISKHIDNYTLLGLSMDMRLDLQDEHLDYMSYHRDVVFEGTGNY